MITLKLEICKLVKLALKVFQWIGGKVIKWVLQLFMILHTHQKDDGLSYSKLHSELLRTSFQCWECSKSR